jgi:hypothetical protein
MYVASYPETGEGARDYRECWVSAIAATSAGSGTLIARRATMESEDGLRRRAFQLAYISEELALASDRLGEQARAIAAAAAKLAETSEELISRGAGSPQSSTTDEP